MLINDDEFIEKWNQYAGVIAAIEDTARFKEQTRYDKGTPSLREFANDPPLKSVDLSKQVDKFLDSVTIYFDKVEKAERKIKTITVQENELNKDIRDAQNELDAKKVDRVGRPGSDSRARADKAAREVQRLERKKATDMDQSRTNAKNAKMEAAKSRIKVLTELKELHLLLDKGLDRKAGAESGRP